VASSDVLGGQQEITLKLHPGQLAIWNSSARFKVVAAGRRFGKSHVAAVSLAAAVMKTEHRGHLLNSEYAVYYVAPTQDQARRIIWSKLRNIMGYEAQGGLIRNENTNDGWIEAINGRRIYIKGADNPDSLRGIGLSFVVLDEYADMKAFVWDDIISDALADVEGEALFIGTPKGKNHFYKLFMGALTKPKFDPITGRPADWSDWEAFHFQSTDNPFLKESEKRRMLGGNRSIETIKQEVEASFISGGGKVLKPDWFEIVEHAPPKNLGTFYITVDLAGFKKEGVGGKPLRTDESVIVEVQIVEDTWYVVNVQHGHWDARESALNIVVTLRNYDSARFGIEQGMAKEAVAGYLEEYMRAFGTYRTIEELRHGGQHKTDRILWALQGRAQRRRIKLVRGEWNDWLLGQIADFPDPLAKDDGIDALAYVDQLSVVVYQDESEIEEWQPLDLDAGI
jgi:hypothetical protein